MVAEVMSEIIAMQFCVYVIDCYLNQIPPFVEVEMERLYNTLHSSLAFFQTFRSTEGVSSYVVWRDDQVVAILLFKLADGRIQVLNEMIEIDQEEVDRFASYMFSKFPKVSLIQFDALATSVDGLRFPLQRNDAKETYVIGLPDTPEDYTAALGKSTRTTIRYQMNKLAREHPTFAVRFYEEHEIDEETIRSIIKFSEDRIASKSYQFKHDEQRIISLAKKCGFVVVLLIDGRICAGSVNYRIGSNYFSELIGSDFAYSSYGLGNITNYLTICECIKKRGNNFYLGGGHFDHKGRLLGVKQSMDKLVIYRSHAAILLNLDQAAKTWAGAHLRQAKVWLHEHKDHLFSQCIFKSYYFLKNLGRSG